MFRFKNISALSLSLSFPTVIAESKSEKEKSKEKPYARMVKPSQLPIYEEPSDFFKYEYYGKEKSKLVEGISVVRKELESVYDATEGARTSVKHVYETGKAHSLTAVDYILDEENVAAKVGAITGGGLLGLLIGGRRKGFLKKIFYMSVGATGAAALVYPKEASRLSKEIYNNADDYYPIAYNFIAGIKPQGETKPPGPKETAKDPPQKSPTEKGTPSKDIVVRSPKSAPVTPIQGDVGMSHPEDKDMYTTRS